MKKETDNQKALLRFQKGFSFKTINISEEERKVLLKAMAILEREVAK